MTMYRLLIIWMLFFALPMPGEAQEATSVPEQHVVNRHKMMDDQIQVERIAYFTEKIGLTTEEAQLFWPVYNEMDKRRTALFEERASIIHRFMNEPAKLNDKQIDEYLNRLAAIQQEEMTLPAEYAARFRKVLPARKVMNLHVAEMGFRSYLLQKMRSRRLEMHEKQ